MAFDDFELPNNPGFYLLTEAWFILDIIINLNTGYYEKGVLIMERDKIIK